MTIRPPRRSSSPFPSFLSVLLLLSPVSARADVPQGVEEALFMDLPVFTPSKFVERVSKTAAVVTVVERSEMENMGARTLADVANLVPGFEMNRTYHFGLQESAAVRGRVTDGGEDVLVLLDGQRLNDVQTGGGFANLKFLPLHNVKRVEFIRGPGSTIHGSNAFAGVINVITHQPDSPGRRSVSLMGGGLEAVGAETEVVQDLGPLHLDVSARWVSDGGDTYDMARGFMRPDNPADVRRPIEDPVHGAYDAGLKAGWRGFFLQADYARRRLRGFLPGAFDSAVLEENRDESRHFRAQAGWNWDLSGDLRLIPVVRYSEGKLRDVFFLAEPGSGMFPPFVSSESVGWYGGPTQATRNVEAELQANWRLGVHQVVGGVVHQREELTYVANLFNVNPFVEGFPFAGDFDRGSDITAFEGQASYGDPRGRDVLGLYVQDTWQAGGRTSVNAGLRYDRYSDFGHAFSPRLGVVQELSPGCTVKLLYGRAYRAPTFDELYSRNNPAIVGNKDVKAQHIDTFELNAIRALGAGFQSTVSVYHNIYRDLILKDALAVTYNSPEKQKDWGGEAELRWKRTELRYFSASFSFVEPKNEDGDLQSDVARLRASAVANWDVVPGKVVLNATSFFHGARKNRVADPSHDIRDTAVINGNVRVLDLFPGVRLDLSFFDIMDEQRKSPTFAPVVLLPENLPTRGFQWLAKLTYAF